MLTFSEDISTILMKLRSYLWAILLIIIATLPLYLLRGSLSDSTVALSYLLPVLLSATTGGLGPGLLSAFLSFLTFNYFFIEPYHTLIVHRPQDVAALVVFLIVAALISQLMSNVRRSLSIALNREHEITRYYELSMALNSTRELPDILKIVASFMLDTFRAEDVEIFIKNMPNQAPIYVHVPTENVHPGAKPTALLPLQTAEGLLGEIRIWIKDAVDSDLSQHMMQTFASQAAQAVERAILLQSEMRARLLEESDQFKSSLLNSVSHELRTPLATIKAAVTGLLSGEVEWESNARQELLEVVDEETDLLNRLVGNLLDMSRLEAGALLPDIQWNDLAEIVERALQDTRRIMEGFHIAVDIPESIPLVPVDFWLLERVFTNLLSNSSKYAQPGTQIEIIARLKSAKILLVQLTNEGPPVPVEHLKRIFDKFYRVTDRTRVTGTGLGLSICKGIIQAHAGKIWAENIPGKFAFFFTLPLTIAGKPPAAVESKT